MHQPKSKLKILKTVPQPSVFHPPPYPIPFTEYEETDHGIIVQVNNVVHSFRLQSTTFDKKSYLTYLKGYMKAVKAHLQEHNPDRLAGFEKEAAEAAKKVIANFKDYEFFTGESMNPDG